MTILLFRKIQNEQNYKMKTEQSIGKRMYQAEIMLSFEQKAPIVHPFSLLLAVLSYWG